MSKLKVATIVGTRPELIRLSRLIPKLDVAFDHLLIHTSQNNSSTLSDVFFSDLSIRQPNYFLESSSESLGATMADVFSKTYEILRAQTPDAVMILGDTNSALSAIVAERLAIPVYHMEAGNRSFDANVPEEINRKLVDHVATFNLPYNEYSRRNLLAEGLHPRFIQITGSPIREIFEFNKEKIEASGVLANLGLNQGKYFLVSLHRQENIDRPENLGKILAGLRLVHEKWKLPIVVSTHPRLRQKLENLGGTKELPFVFLEPFGYLDYNKLQLDSLCVISDSGTISEESAIMRFRAVTLRNSMERPEALAAGTIVMSGLEPEGLLRSILHVLDREPPNVFPEGYEVADFSDRVLTFVQSTAALAKQWTSRA